MSQIEPWIIKTFLKKILFTNYIADNRTLPRVSQPFWLIMLEYFNIKGSKISYHLIFAPKN